MISGGIYHRSWAKNNLKCVKLDYHNQWYKDRNSKIFRWGNFLTIHTYLVAYVVQVIPALQNSPVDE